MNNVPALGPWHEECEAWSQFYKFASGLYLQEPSQGKIEESRRVGELLHAHLPDASFPQLLAHARIEDAETIKQEYYDLFFVPVSGTYCPPFEAVYTEGKLNQTEVGLLYQATGFEIGLLANIPSYLKLLNRPDHIGFELAFISNMLTTIAREPDDSKAHALHETCLTFCRKHFSAWAADFGRKVKEAAQTPYFQACGEITSFLASPQIFRPFQAGEIAKKV